MTEPRAYLGRDLEAMAFAVNYHRWILSIFKPFMGTRVVEVGAGTGSFSELLLELHLESLSLIEPSEAMYKRLRERVAKIKGQTRIRMYNGLLSEAAGEIESTQSPDSIVYVNVLEHIANDDVELRIVYKTLAKGGRILVFVPAFRWLFGEIDKQLGHQRRYTGTELRAKCVGAGFKVLELRYFDVLGIALWWVKYCLFKSDTMEASLVGLHDKYLVPVSKVVESFIAPPAGKNLILIGEKV